MSEASESKQETMEDMGNRLVEEALGDSGVQFSPMDDRVLIFPVVPDEKRPVDLTILQLGGQDLPEMGVVVRVGYDVNAKVLEASNKLDATSLPQAEKDAQRMALLDTEFLGAGDVVCVNKFSGMDVPGTNFVLVSRLDVLGKLRHFPVRLRKDQDRWDQLDEKQKAHEAEVGREKLAVPSKIIV